MEILRDLSLFWSMAHVTVLFLMLFRSKYQKRKTVIISTAVIGALMAINMCGLVFYGAAVMSKLILFTCSIPSFIFFYILSTDKNFSYLFTFCLADTVCLWILGVTNLLDHFLGGGRYILMFILRLIAFPLLEYVVYKKFRTLYGELQKAVRTGWGSYAGITVLYYVLLLLVLEYPTAIAARPEYIPACILVLLLMVFNYIIIFASLVRQYKLYESEKAESLLQEQKQTLENQLENQRHIRKIRHDMRGHTITLQGLLKLGKLEEAQEYLEEIQKSISVSDAQICPNPYINAQLSHYLQKFREIGTELAYDIKIGSEDISFTQVCSILSNGLQNALEALSDLPPEEREVSLQMKYSKDYLIIRLRNRCSPELHVEKGSILKTSKTGKNHGFGLQSIQETATALGGDMLCYTENGCFILDVMLRKQAVLVR